MKENIFKLIYKYGKRIFIIVASILIAFSSIYVYRLITLKPEDPPPVITSQLINQKLISMSELVTVKYMYTAVGKFENNNTFYGYNIPLTKKSFLLIYEGSMKAGIDMKNIDVEVTDTEIILKLPEPTIISHEINPETIEVYDESNNILNSIKINDITTFFSEERKKQESKAIEQGILKEAENQGKSSILNLLTSIDVINESGKSIVFK